MSSFLYKWFHPTIDAIFSTLPLRTRWRLLLFQPLAILAYSINIIPNLFSRRFSSFRIPTRSGSVRAIVFQPPPSRIAQGLRPLHLDIHGGGFVGGHPEADHRFCSHLSDRTGAVVVSASYRFAPKHPFPAAIDDINDVVKWLQANAESKLKANPKLFTISGSSAGGNLALAACLQPSCHEPAPTAIKAAVTFYAPIDCRIPPINKPVPANFPKRDPIAFMLPLYDSYGLPTRPASLTDPRCNPILAEATKLPRRVLMIIPTIDILLHEQLTFVERVKDDIEKLGREGEGRTMEAMIMDDCFHGWLELPSIVIKEETRQRVFERSVEVIREVQRREGWDFDAVR
jgi:acetyl esterase/lipase